LRIISAFFLGLLLTGAAILLFMYSGIYNIAASQPQTGAVQWVRATVMNNSIRTRAGAIAAPPLEILNWEDGFKSFDKLCVGCHGAPGILPSGIGSGLLPEPPDLSLRTDAWSAAELYWIIENGLKFTGMPGFGNTQSTDAIWNIVAFLRTLPVTSGKDYQQLQERLETGPLFKYQPEYPEELQPGDRQQMLLRQI
jgi:mono/diheme cytochrome c family protein